MQSGPSVGTDLTRAQLESHVGKGSRWRELKTIAHILFVVLDHDASGTISFSEFASGVALIKASRDSLSEDATKEFAFRALDLNHSGYIERSELLSWVKVLQGIGGLKPQDANARLMCVGQGDVGGGFGRTVSAQELTSKFMKAMDADGAPRVVQSLCYSKCFTCSGLSRAHLLQPAHPYLSPGRRRENIESGVLSAGLSAHGHERGAQAAGHRPLPRRLERNRPREGPRGRPRARQREIGTS